MFNLKAAQRIEQLLELFFVTLSAPDGYRDERSQAKKATCESLTFCLA